MMYFIQLYMWCMAGNWNTNRRNPIYLYTAITKAFLPLVFVIHVNSMHDLQYKSYGSQNDLYIWQAILKLCPSNMNVALLKILNRL